jgi:4-aminobutyrate aminotransferase
MSLSDHDMASRVEQVAFRKGLLILGCGDADLRISPPLVFREDQAHAALEIFDEVLTEVEAEA